MDVLLRRIPVFFCILAICLSSPLPKEKPGYPVVLVPGDGGSQFEAKLNKPATIRSWCTQKTDYWFSFWLNLELLAPYALECFVDNMRLTYDNKTRKTSNSPGVSTRQPGFGNTSSVEWLDPSQYSITSYFAPIANSLVKSGYTRDLNIRGAPYDFRKAPNENGMFIANLKALIEETYKKNNKKVVLIGHSMGNPYVLNLLNRMTQAWKNKFIRSYIALAGPWGGAAKTMRLMASGDNLGVFIVNPLSVRREQRTMPSTAWLMPSDSFWNSSEVLVQGPKRNYTVKDYQQFFKDIDFMTGWYMRQDTEHINKELKAPGVEVHCLHGVGVPTPAGFKYTKSMWPDYQPDVINGEGDGTVNMRSLLGCLRWQKAQPQQVFHKTFPKVSHMAILDNADVEAYIKTVLFSN